MLRPLHSAALLLVPLRLPARTETVEAKSFFTDLRQGWDEFRRQTWIWTTIVFFGIGNFAFASYWVLGPIVAKQDLGGAPAWAALTAAFSVGALVGGLLALRIRPKKPLAASCMAAWVFLLQPLGMGLGLPLWTLIVFSVLCGCGLAIHIALWFTVFQQNVPEESISRVSSYDSFGSFVLLPLGAALAGPVAAVFGVQQTLLAAALVIAITQAIVYAQPSVHAIRAKVSPKLARRDRADRPSAPRVIQPMKVVMARAAAGLHRSAVRRSLRRARPTLRARRPR